jgi:hypothetical protein
MYGLLMLLLMPFLAMFAEVATNPSQLPANSKVGILCYAKHL